MAQKISLKIAGHLYNLTAATEEQEQLYRLAAEAINNRFASYNLSHPGRTATDMLSMVALSETVIRIGLQKEIEALKKGEDQLEMDLEKYLRDIQ
ncbi:MAG: cell division protein ZapA [Bacteroidales bacterium]|nr:cell division protein ZapA [Bacteroidales bacterium]